MPLAWQISAMLDRACCLGVSLARWRAVEDQADTASPVSQNTSGTSHVIVFILMRIVPEG